MHPSVHHTLCAVDGTNAINLLLKPELVETAAHAFSTDTVIDKMIRKKSFFIMNMSENKEWSDFLQSFRHHGSTALTEKSDYVVYLNQLARLLLMTVILSEKEHNENVLLKEFDEKTQNPAKQIIEYACSNFATVSVSELSRKFGYSRMQIYRFFVKQTGYDFNDYISVQRYERAVSLLVHSDMPIAEISERLGLERNYFCRFFKAKFSMTPSQYRRYSRENKL